MEYVSFLRQHINQVVKLSNDDFDKVQTFFKPITIDKKDYLINSGKKVKAEYLVVSGLLKAFMFDDQGKEHIIQFAMENWWVSDYPAYKQQATGEICVQALEPCIVLELTLDNKNNMCQQVPAMYQFHATKAFGGFVALQKRVLSLMKNSAKEKYELLLEQYPELFQRVSKTMIAHYLGVSRETLSRLQK